MCTWLSWEGGLIKMQILISRSGIGFGILHLWQAFRWYWCCWSKDHTLSSKGVASFLLAQFCGYEGNQFIWIIWWKEQSRVSELFMNQRVEFILLLKPLKFKTLSITAISWSTQGLSFGERKWQFTPAILPGKSQGQSNLVGYSPWGCKRVRHGWGTKHQQ